MRVLLRSPPLMLILGILVISACTEPTTSIDQDATITLTIVSGDEQVWIAGYELPDVLAVKVTGVRDRPVPNHLVNFRVLDGGGSVFAGSALTSEFGIAKEYWTLGPEPGENILEVRSVDPKSGEKEVWARFTATGRPWPEELTSLRSLVSDRFVLALVNRLPAKKAEELRALLTVAFTGLGEELDLTSVEEALASAHYLVTDAEPPNVVEYGFLDLIFGHCEVLFEQAMQAILA